MIRLLFYPFAFFIALTLDVFCLFDSHLFLMKIMIYLNLSLLVIITSSCFGSYLNDLSPSFLYAPYLIDYIDCTTDFMGFLSENVAFIMNLTWLSSNIDFDFYCSNYYFYSYYSYSSIVRLELDLFSLN